MLAAQHTLHLVTSPHTQHTAHFKQCTPLPGHYSMHTTHIVFIPGEPPPTASSAPSFGFWAKPSQPPLSISDCPSTPAAPMVSPSPPPPYLSWRSWAADKRWGCLKPAGGALQGGAPDSTVSCRQGCGKVMPRSQHRKMKTHISSCSGPTVASPDLPQPSLQIPVTDQVQCSTQYTWNRQFCSDGIKRTLGRGTTVYSACTVHFTPCIFS